ncbi:MAG TPA: hypothetical protein VNN22_17145 [Verrucomicrobiae bacterium]|nr:hypothetical protein [Verrucomicrobiae bacterium]
MAASATIFGSLSDATCFPAATLNSALGDSFTLESSTNFTGWQALASLVLIIR